MTGTAPSIVTFKSALKTTLAAAMPGVQVSYGWPGDVIERQSIWIAGVDGQLAIPTMKAGRKHRDEAYEVTVIIDVLAPGGSVEEAETTALSYFTTVDDTFANNPGAVSNLVTTLGRFSLNSGIESSASWARLQIGLNVTNRLT